MAIQKQFITIEFKSSAKSSNWERKGTDRKRYRERDRQIERDRIRQINSTETA